MTELPGTTEKGMDWMKSLEFCALKFMLIKASSYFFTLFPFHKGTEDSLIKFSIKGHHPHHLLCISELVINHKTMKKIAK